MTSEYFPNDKARPIVYVLNGPNLNLLGIREPKIYGRETLADVETECRRVGAELGLEVEFRQTNAEYQLIDWIHEARLRAAGMVLNPAAFTHTSVAILDALSTCEFPIFEVHISNIHKREEFRHHSFVSRVAEGVICGCGTQGYLLAIQRLARLIGSPRTRED
jgi:3-dehydroquinate dehydratase II